MENQLNISNWVKHRIPSFCKMIGLSLGRYEKMCIMLCPTSSFFFSEPYLNGSLCGETILFLF